MDKKVSNYKITKVREKIHISIENFTMFYSRFDRQLLKATTLKNV